MSLKSKLLLALAPLALALALMGTVSSTVITRLAEQSRLILSDNYRSVLAAQRMKESLQRLDRAALFVITGYPRTAAADITGSREAFEHALRVQDANITEAGEAAVTQRLRLAWNEYRQALEVYQALPAAERSAAYFSALQPGFGNVNRLADEILSINQDAMVRKSNATEKRAHQFEQLVLAAVVLALVVGLFASSWLTARMLRPLGVVSAAVRRFGQGDQRARVNVQGKDEIAAVAVEFNDMADRLARYRASSLGELLQAQQTAQAAIDGLPDPVLLLDGNGNLQGANAAASKLLAIDLERPAAEVYASADPGVRAVVERLRGHVLGGKGPYVPKGFEDAVRVACTPDGERIFVPRATPIYTESGTVGGAALVLQDSTRLFRFDELKNNLVATVAHEFRTPLTSLRMALHLCTEEIAGPLTAKQADLLFAAREDCERLQVMVDDLLNLSRIESGHIDLHRRRIEPQTLVDMAIDVHRAAAEQARVNLRTEMPPGLPEVFVDPDRLQLVLTNLLSNAIRYAPTGTDIVVRALAEAPTEPTRDHRLAAPDHIRFEVTDQGPGIPPEHQMGLFDKFFRVPGSPAGGSGLGLFIAKGLVQAHDGKIGLRQEADQGATFWFTVPTAPAAGPAPTYT